MMTDDSLGRGRAALERRAWQEAFEALSDADRRMPLGIQDLERLSTAAHMIGRDEISLEVLERAHRACVQTGEIPRAARCAFWLGLRLMFRGEHGRGTGWLSRAQRVLDEVGHEGVERGYLLLPRAEVQLAEGSHRDAFETSRAAVAAGRKHEDRDLTACALHLQGRAQMLEGDVEAGLALLDEAMLAVVAGELSPMMTGLIYCSVIEACQQMYALGRANEWTSALSRWCGEQPQMVAFTQTCLVYRAEIMQTSGAWEAALAEADRACSRGASGAGARPSGAAFYQRAEVLRLRGDFEAAESAYRDSSQWGREPQPGLALLRLAQGRTNAAVTSIRLAVESRADPLERVRLLPTLVEIMLAAGETWDARAVLAELEATAGRYRSDALHAMAAQARAAVALGAGEPKEALVLLRKATSLWMGVQAPYAAARVRVMAGIACRALGDDDAARLEFDAARTEFARLGAVPDLARLDTLGNASTLRKPHGLTSRELQVLRLVSAGKTNRAIADQLYLSEKTIDRHVSNIFGKLGVPTRAAATAFAYRNGLI